MHHKKNMLDDYKNKIKVIEAYARWDLKKK